MSEFIDTTAPSYNGGVVKKPGDLPHGLLTPPERVRQVLANEKAKQPHVQCAPGFEEKLLNEWTLQYYFEYQTDQVLYRQTPAGPEVLAVGFEEIFARTKGMDPEAMQGLSLWMS